MLPQERIAGHDPQYWPGRVPERHLQPFGTHLRFWRPSSPRATRLVSVPGAGVADIRSATRIEDKAARVKKRIMLGIGVRNCSKSEGQYES